MTSINKCGLYGWNTLIPELIGIAMVNGDM